MCKQLSKTVSDNEEWLDLTLTGIADDPCVCGIVDYGSRYGPSQSSHVMLVCSFVRVGACIRTLLCVFIYACVCMYFL